MRDESTCKGQAATHYAGCACHENRRDAEIEQLKARVEKADAELAAHNAKACDKTVKEIYAEGFNAGAEAMREKIARWYDDGEASAEYLGLEVIFQQYHLHLTRLDTCGWIGE